MAVFVAFSLVLSAACSGDDDATDDDTASAEPAETTTTTIDPSLVAPLTGVTGTDAAALGRSALVVKIDNVEQARPQAGLDSADIIFEEQVEGNVTRLVAVFHSSLPELVGPVRSTRSTDFDLLPMFGRPVYASSGGNAGIMGGLAGVDIIDVGHNRNGNGFARERGRSAPHNLMATVADLYAQAGEEANTAPTPVFGFRDDEADPVTGEPVTSVGFAFGGSEISRFDWNATAAVWERSQRGTPHTVVDGSTLDAVNVVAIDIDYTFGNPVGMSNPHGISTGEGTAMVFLDGQVIRGTWSRATPSDPFTLLDSAGAEILLNPGRTFIELVPTAESVVIG